MRRFFGITRHWYFVLFLCGGLMSSVPAAAADDSEEKARSLAAYTIGVMHDLQGQTEQAISAFQRSADIQDNYAVHLRMGASYARMGQLEDAIVELEKVLKMSPDNVQARYLLALIYSTQKRFDKAAAEYEAILPGMEPDPENTEIYGYLGLLYYSQKDYQKAIQQFETMLSLNPGNADVIFLVGALYLELNQRSKAMDFFSRAIKVNPEHDTALNSLGYLYAEEGDHLDEAQELIERAVNLDPKNGAYLDSLGWVYYQKGDYESALRYLQEADALLKDPVIYEHIGDVYLKLNQPERAREFWELSLELRPNQVEVQQKLEGLDRQL